MTKKELQETWDSAEKPKLNPSGEYKVKMLTGGPLRLMNIPGDRKIFNDASGYNILCKKTKWGYFNLEEAPGKLVINYNRPENDNMISTIRDHIRYVPKLGYYTGKFNMLIKGKLHFLGWFTLTKTIKEAVNDRKNAS